MANIATHVDLVPIEFDQASVREKQKNRVEVDFIRKAARQGWDYFFNIQDIWTDRYAVENGERNDVMENGGRHREARRRD